VPPPVETEIKLRMEGPDSARRAVTALGATLEGARHLEDNTLTTPSTTMRIPRCMPRGRPCACAGRRVAPS